jgi:hypothetical protein
MMNMSIDKNLHASRQTKKTEQHPTAYFWNTVCLFYLGQDFQYPVAHPNQTSVLGESH